MKTTLRFHRPGTRTCKVYDAPCLALVLPLSRSRYFSHQDYVVPGPLSHLESSRNEDPYIRSLFFSNFITFLRSPLGHGSINSFENPDFLNIWTN
jgi:hypothetical protein